MPESLEDRLSRIKASAYGKETKILTILKTLTDEELEQSFSDDLESLLQSGRIHLPPTCPHCKEGVETINTTQNVVLDFIEGTWKRNFEDNQEVFQCANCGEELRPEDLDALLVPNDLR